MSETYEKALAITNSHEISNRHTFYQLKHFVIGKEPTIQAKLQKCLKEIDARKESIKNMKLSMDEAEDDINLINLKIKSINKKKIKSSLNKEYREIQIRKFERKKTSLLDSIKSIQKKLKETEEETEFFLRTFSELEKIESLKPYDDLKSNMNFWNENFSQELKLRILLQKPMDLELVKCILSLNNEAPIKQELLQLIENARINAIEQTKKLKLEGNANG